MPDRECHPGYVRLERHLGRARIFCFKCKKTTKRYRLSKSALKEWVRILDAALSEPK